MIGVYESSTKKMSFETGIPADQIEVILAKFENAKKIKRVGAFVVVLNFIKNQNYNPNMMKSAIDTYNNLPNVLKANDLVIGKESLSNGLERVRNGLVMVRKVEVEYEVETKVEVEVETESKTEQGESIDSQIIAISEGPIFDEFWNAYQKKVDKVKCEKAWNKLSLPDKNSIMWHVYPYVESTPDIQFRKNPLTYLNSKSWNNDIIKPTTRQSERKGFIPANGFARDMAEIIANESGDMQSGSPIAKAAG